MYTYFKIKLPIIKKNNNKNRSIQDIYTFNQFSKYVYIQKVPKTALLHAILTIQLKLPNYPNTKQFYPLRRFSRYIVGSVKRRGNVPGN